MIFPKWILKSIGLLLLVFFLTSCQGSLISNRLPRGVGVYHVVQLGQTPYRIARTYGLDVKQLIRVNRISDPARVSVGTRLWIPGAYRVLYVSSKDHPKRPVPKKKSIRKKPANKKSKKNRAPVKNYLRWPVKGTLTSTFGQRR